jgi:RNA 3'-phosphate cyclase
LLKIDGSYGEGGGQILRNAVACSVLTKKPVKITNIRANRPNPGIKAQHYVAMKSMAELCNAEVEGLEIGSKTISFTPGKIKGGWYKFDVGTAGSVTLVFQACILASLKTKEQITINLSGGTDVKWSPSWDYFENVYLGLLMKMGLKIYPKLFIRGYYPRGGGEAVITIDPCDNIKPLILNDVDELDEVKGIVNISNLPEHVSKRIHHSAVKTFLKNNLMTSIEIDSSTSLSPGVGITLWSAGKKSIIGVGLLGEKGVNSEEVGKTVAVNFLKEIASESNIDAYAFDQLLPFMVLAKKLGKSTCIVRELTNHASTNMWLLKQFFDVDFKIIQTENNIQVEVF